uniref:Uncharacterized protein n=1 Tax=Steinernema glaseri TaxID=37863 RepID=A0A1I8AC47_9BILA
MSESALWMWKEMFLPRPDTKYMFPSTIMSRDLKKQAQVLVVVGARLEQKQRKKKRTSEETHRRRLLLDWTNDDGRSPTAIGYPRALFINKGYKNSGANVATVGMGREGDED